MLISMLCIKYANWLVGVYEYRMQISNNIGSADNLEYFVLRNFVVAVGCCSGKGSVAGLAVGVWIRTSYVVPCRKVTIRTVVGVAAVRYDNIMTISKYWTAWSMAVNQIAATVRNHFLEKIQLQKKRFHSLITIIISMRNLIPGVWRKSSNRLVELSPNNNQSIRNVITFLVKCCCLKFMIGCSE